MKIFHLKEHFKQTIQNSFLAFVKANLIIAVR